MGQVASSLPQCLPDPITRIFVNTEQRDTWIEKERENRQKLDQTGVGNLLSDEEKESGTQIMLQSGFFYDSDHAQQRIEELALAESEGAIIDEHQPHPSTSPSALRSASSASASLTNAPRVKIPSSVLVKIFQYLPLRDLLRIARTGRQYYSIAQQPGVWTKTHLLRILSEEQMQLVVRSPVLCNIMAIQLGMIEGEQVDHDMANLNLPTTAVDEHQIDIGVDNGGRTANDRLVDSASPVNEAPAAGKERTHLLPSAPSTAAVVVHVLDETIVNGVPSVSSATHGSTASPSDESLTSSSLSHTNPASRPFILSIDLLYSLSFLNHLRYLRIVYDIRHSSTLDVSDVQTSFESLVQLEHLHLALATSEVNQPPRSVTSSEGGADAFKISSLWLHSIPKLTSLRSLVWEVPFTPSSLVSSCDESSVPSVSPIVAPKLDFSLLAPSNLKSVEIIWQGEEGNMPDAAIATDRLAKAAPHIRITNKLKANHHIATHA